MPYLGAKPADAAVNTLAHTTTIGDGTAADALIKFDGNAQDFHIGLDDTADDLVIGLGAALGTTTHMSFDEAGVISMPLQPSAYVHLSGNQSIANETAAKITHDTEVYDINGDFASNKFTCPVDGIYLMIGTVSMSVADADSVITYLFVNGADISRDGGSAAMSGHHSQSSVMIKKLDASDYVEHYVYHSFGSSRDLTGSIQYTNMQVHKIA